MKKIKRRTLRALVDAYQNPEEDACQNPEELGVLFRRVRRLVEADPNICSKAEWRMMVGLHSHGDPPRPPEGAPYVKCGTEIAQDMARANFVYDDGTGREIFSNEEVEMMVWAGFGRAPLMKAMGQ